MIPERAASLVTADGVTLEGRLAVPDGATTGVVVCHPHPLYGGDMDNPVVLTVARACLGLTLATLRFNFRGVGASGGAHDGGRGEQADARAAVEALRPALPPGARVALAGYSFGALVAAAVAAAGPDIGGLALIAPPLATGALPPLHAVAAPVLIVAGSRDHVCPAAALERLREHVSGAEIHVLAGADHFFVEGASALARAVGGWAARLQAGQARGRGGAR